MNYYNYNNEKIYIFLLTLKDTSDWRKENIKQNKINNPKINICYGIDGYNSNLIQELIKKYNIPLPERVLNDKNKPLWKLSHYGKLGRWLSTIMITKLSYDLDINVIVIEDDILLPPNFDFQFNKYINNKGIVRLGEWGDGYYFNKMSSKFFLELVYSKGIITNDDNMIIDEVSTKKFNLLSRIDYGVCNDKRNNELSSIEIRNKPIDFVFDPIIKIINKNTWRYLLQKRIIRTLNKAIDKQFIEGVKYFI